MKNEYNFIQKIDYRLKDNRYGRKKFSSKFFVPFEPTLLPPLNQNSCLISDMSKTHYAILSYHIISIGIYKND